MTPIRPSQKTEKSDDYTYSRDCRSNRVHRPRPRDAAGGGAPTGAVTFKEGSSTLGTGTLASGLGSWSTAGMSMGSHTLTAQYEGDENFNASTSAVLAQVVTAQPQLRGFYLPLIQR